MIFYLFSLIQGFFSSDLAIKKIGSWNLKCERGGGGGGGGVPKFGSLCQRSLYWYNRDRSMIKRPRVTGYKKVRGRFSSK